MLRFDDAVEEVGYLDFPGHSLRLAGVIERLERELETETDVGGDVSRRSGLEERFHRLPRFVGCRVVAALQLNRVQPQRRSVPLGRLEVQPNRDKQKWLRWGKCELVPLPFLADRYLFAQEMARRFVHGQLRNHSLRI